jgi:alkylation response protein AidB-like acyl-CoA dehydrogenase
VTEPRVGNRRGANGDQRAALDACRSRGSRGTGEDSLVGRVFRDAKVSEIVEGASPRSSRARMR